MGIAGFNAFMQAQFKAAYAARRSAAALPFAHVAIDVNGLLHQVWLGPLAGSHVAFACADLICARAQVARRARSEAHLFKLLFRALDTLLRAHVRVTTRVFLAVDGPVRPSAARSPPPSSSGNVRLLIGSFFFSLSHSQFAAGVIGQAANAARAASGATPTRGTRRHAASKARCSV